MSLGGPNGGDAGRMTIEKGVLLCRLNITVPVPTKGNALLQFGGTLLSL